MEIKLSEFEVEKLKEIVIYFLEVPRKLWKQHYDYVNDLRTINLSACTIKLTLKLYYYFLSFVCDNLQTVIR